MLKFSHSIKTNDTYYNEAKQTEPYVIFTVDDEKFGVEAKKTLELVKYSKPLEMPHNFINVQGMSNFRGKIIPIIDLRLVFGLEPIAYDANTVTIVIDSGPITFGITAERVLDLLMVPVNSIKQIDNFNFGEKTKYLKSVANFGDHMILLLNLDKIIETKPAPDMSEEITGSQSLLINELPVAPGLFEQNNEGKVSLLENVSVEDHPYELSAAEPKVLQKDDPPPLTEERSKITEDTMDQVCINDDSGMKNEGPPDYLIDPQELEDLLNEAALKSERGTEKPWAPETDYETQNHPGDLLAPSELDQILAEIEQENEGEDEKIQMMDGGPTEGVAEAGLDDEPPITLPEDSSDGILKPEQVDEILLSLQKGTALDLPEEPFQINNEIAIDLNQTDHWFSDQAIEKILKELEIESGTKSGESFSDGENQKIMTGRLEALEEKPDV